MSLVSKVLMLTLALVLSACSDDTTPPSVDQRVGGQDSGQDLSQVLDGKTAEASTVAEASTAAEAGTKEASISSDQSAAGKTPCGPSLECDSATQVCVVSQAHVADYACQAVPAGCESQRNCTCMGATLCTGNFNICTDGASGTSNTITCECPIC